MPGGPKKKGDLRFLPEIALTKLALFSATRDRPSRPTPVKRAQPSPLRK